MNQDSKNTDLPVNDLIFNLPKEKGKYIIVLELFLDRGSAKYAWEYYNRVMPRQCECAIFTKI